MWDMVLLTEDNFFCALMATKRVSYNIDNPSKSPFEKGDLVLLRRIIPFLFSADVD